VCGLAAAATCQPAPHTPKKHTHTRPHTCLQRLQFCQQPAHQLAAPRASFLKLLALHQAHIPPEFVQLLLLLLLLLRVALRTAAAASRHCCHRSVLGGGGSGRGGRGGSSGVAAGPQHAQRRCDCSLCLCIEDGLVLLLRVVWCVVLRCVDTCAAMCCGVLCDAR
jgi:hypothetical protein